MSPREHHREVCGGEQRPFHRPLHYKCAEEEKHQHEGSHVNGTARHGLVAPVLAQLLVNVIELPVGLLHRRLALRQRDGSSALCIRHKQRPRLVYAVAPLRYVVALQSAAGLVGGVFLHQFALAAHRLLAVFPCVVKVAGIERQTDQSTCNARERCLQEMCRLPFADGVNKEGDDHKEHDEQIIICHLHMVGVDFECREKACQEEALQIFPPVGKHYAAYHRRKICQRHHFPQVAGGNDYQKIAGECPHNRSQCGKILLEVESTQHDVESEQVNEQIPNVFGQA